jgi:large subunit ribosomal protein L32
MGAVPKHRISPRRKAKRRTHYKLQPVALVRCGHCEAYHRPHHVCPACGTYRGIEIIQIED